MKRKNRKSKMKRSDMPATAATSAKLQRTTTTITTMEASPLTPEMEELQAFLEDTKEPWWTWRLENSIYTNDKDVMLRAVTDCGHALLYASENLQADKDVVLAAVNNDGSVLEYASENLRADKEVILAAAFNDYGGEAMEFAHPDSLDCTIGDNIHFVRTVIQAWGFFSVAFFDPLSDILSTLYLKLRQASDCQGNGYLQLESCADVPPQVVAKQWLDRLVETQWCLDQACKNGLASSDIQQHICEFSGIANDIETAKELQKYSPIICAVIEKVPGVSWLEFLAAPENITVGSLYK